MHCCNKPLLLLLLLAGWLVSCSLDLPKDVAAAYAALPDKIDYNLHVKPVLSDKCFSCPGPDYTYNLLRLTAAS